VLPKGPVVRVLLVHCCSVEPWVCPCANTLGGIGLFKGKLINLCGKLTQIPMNANGTLTEEDFDIVKFIENDAPFTMLLGKPWIERDQAKRKEEEEVLE
jgi:hypothetical protein